MDNKLQKHNLFDTDDQIIDMGGAYNNQQHYTSYTQPNNNQSTVNQTKTGEAQWYYVDGKTNQKSGPHSDSHIIELYNKNVINDNTYVLRAGMPKWIPFGKSVLKNMVNDGLPEVPLDCVKSTWAWCLAGVQIVAIILAIIGINVPIWAYWIANSVFTILDMGEIWKVRKGLGIWAIWGFTIVPIYLFVRASKVDKKYGYAIVYLIAFIINLGVSGAQATRVDDISSKVEYEKTNNADTKADVDAFKEVTKGMSLKADDKESTEKDNKAQISKNTKDDGAADTSEVNGTKQYKEYSYETLLDDLNNNALKAEQTHQDEYVSVTGYVSTIDSDGQYFSIGDPKDSYEHFLTDIHCDISNNSKARKQLMDMNTYDKVTVKGKITTIGEILGYTIDVDEISYSNNNTNSNNIDDSNNDEFSSDMTTSQRNAIKSARSYLEWDKCSRKALIGQLSSEYGDQYSLADAEFAVSYLEKNGQVDWNEQAYKAAKSYMELSGFSRDELYEQLTSEYGEQFTPEQANYALSKVGY